MALLFQDIQIRTAQDHYGAAVLWAERDNDENTLDQNYSLTDFSEESWNEIFLRVKAFLSDLTEVEQSNLMNTEGYDLAQFGHDLFLSTHGYTCAFIEKVALDPDLAQRLEDLADTRRHGLKDGFYVGDDGKVWSYWHPETELLKTE